MKTVEEITAYLEQLRGEARKTYWESDDNENEYEATCTVRLINKILEWIKKND